jgi:hypothetical protein
MDSSHFRQKGDINLRKFLFAARKTQDRNPSWFAHIEVTRCLTIRSIAIISVKPFYVSSLGPDIHALGCLCLRKSWYYSFGKGGFAIGETCVSKSRNPPLGRKNHSPLMRKISRFHQWKAIEMSQDAIDRRKPRDVVIVPLTPLRRSSTYWTPRHPIDNLSTTYFVCFPTA